MKIHSLIPLLIICFFLTNCSPKNYSQEPVAVATSFTEVEAPATEAPTIWNLNFFQNILPQSHFGFCPACHKDDQLVPIVYGKPAHSAQVKAENGEIVLGGCVVSENSPKFMCRRDKTRF